MTDNVSAIALIFSVWLSANESFGLSLLSVPDDTVIEGYSSENKHYAHLFSYELVGLAIIAINVSL